jgi:hypothetical protein
MYESWANGAFEFGAQPKSTTIDPGAYFQQSRDYADASFGSATSLFQQLASVQVDQKDLAPILSNISTPARPNLGQYGLSASTSSGAASDATGMCSGAGSPCSIVGEILSVKFPSVPDAPVNSVVKLPAERSAPKVPNTRPTIKAPQSPGYVTENAPRPTNLKGYSAPAKPKTDIPEVPGLLSYNIPARPKLIRNPFDEQLQAAPKVTNPVLSFTEPDYTSPVATLLNAKINAWLNAEDLTPDAIIWDAIFDEERDREEQVHLAAIEEARDNVAGGGFRMPPGALNAALRRARQEKANKMSSIARTRAIEEAKMAFENVRLAITSGVQYEGQLIQQADQTAQRAYQAAVWTGDAAKWVVTTEVTLYNAAVEAYKVKSDIYLAWLQAELTKLEEYKAHLEAERLKGQINRDELERYKLALEAVGIQWDTYSKQLDSVRLVLAENEQTIKRDELLVRRFEAVTKGNADLWDAYASQWEGEKIKGELYKADIDAYASEVRGWLGLVEGDKIRSDLKVSIEDLKNRNYTAKMQGIQAQYSGLAQRMGALAQTLNAQAGFADANARLQGALASADAARYRADVDRYATDQRTAIEQARLSLDSAIESAKIATLASAEAAKVAGQIAAAAISIMHVSISQSNSSSSNTSNSYTSSEGTSDSKISQDSYTKIVNCDCE